jgi:hypothetical protein
MSGTVNPAVFEVGHTQVPLHQVRISDPTPRDSVGIRLVYASQPPADIFVPVRRASLTLTPARARINGFGLQKARFEVLLPSELAMDSMPIRLSASQGDALTAYATPSRPAVITIRSSGIRGDTVRAAGPHFVLPAYAPVEYAPPWLFLAASLLGGIAGVIIREANTKAGAKSATLSSNAIAGVLVGLLIAVGYAVGVNLLPIAVTGPPVEAVIFFVSGIGAFLGGAALRDRLLPVAVTHPGSTP